MFLREVKMQMLEIWGGDMRGHSLEGKRGTFDSFEKAYMIFRNYMSFTDCWWIFLEEKRIFPKSVQDFSEWDALERKAEKINLSQDTRAFTNLLK